MEKESARSQTLEQLHERRKQVVRLYKTRHQDHANRHDDGAELPDSAKCTIDLFEAGGWGAIRPACSWASPGRWPCAHSAQEETIQRMIIDKRPEQLKMDFSLWSRAAVGQLIEQEFGIKLQSAQYRQVPHPLGLHAAKAHQARLRAKPCCSAGLAGGRVPRHRATRQLKGLRFTGAMRRPWSTPMCAAEASRQRAKHR
jgi:hypothetical protein